jgi:hypothetical protein
MKMWASSKSTERETQWRRNYRINDYFAIDFKIINNSEKNAVRDGVFCK